MMYPASIVFPKPDIVGNEQPLSGVLEELEQGLELEGIEGGIRRTE